MRRLILAAAISFLTVAAANAGSEVKCLADNMFFEARGEVKRHGEEAMLMVGQVTMNRMADERWPDSVCGVVFEASQFSWTKKRPKVNLRDPIERRAYIRSYRLAIAIMSGQVEDQSNGATFFYNYRSVEPRWASRFVHVRTVGNHRFLK